MKRKVFDALAILCVLGSALIREEKYLQIVYLGVGILIGIVADDFLFSKKEER